jgi:hypothetical protein
MTNLYVAGSFLRDPIAAYDIDMMVPEFLDDRMYVSAVTLEPYECIARAWDKPIDLKFTSHPEDFNVMGWFDPKVGRWQFSMAFCGKYFFCGPMMETSLDALLRADRTEDGIRSLQESYREIVSRPPADEAVGVGTARWQRTWTNSVLEVILFPLVKEDCNLPYFVPCPPLQKTKGQRLLVAG